MQEDKLKKFITTHKDNFSENQLADVSDRVSRMSDTQSAALMEFKTRSCSLMLWISILFGWMGMDSFLLGRIGRGVVKFLTLGGIGILWIIDIVRCRRNTQDYNYKRFYELMSQIYGYF